MRKAIAGLQELGLHVAHRLFDVIESVLELGAQLFASLPNFRPEFVPKFRDILLRGWPVAVFHCENPFVLYASDQNRVTSVKLKSRTCMAGATMSKVSSPEARTAGDSASTFDNISISP